jgi:REP element-mobilizing transposase RayT
MMNLLRAEGLTKSYGKRIVVKQISFRTRSHALRGNATVTLCVKTMRSRYKYFHNTSPYFVTCTVVNWIAIFTSPVMFDIIIESLRFLRETGSLKIFSYVILENHLHMIVSSEDLSNNMMRFKSYTARKIIDFAESKNNTWLLKQFKEEKKDFKNDRTYQVWQEGFHPQLIQSEEMLRQKIEYIHYNPVRRGYIDDPSNWVYSSARNYLKDDNSILEIDFITL